jgi:aryl-alcohol dehydrogenase-like predicted oxidoreductase
MGFLAGSVRADSRFESAPVMDFRAISPRFAPEVLPANMALVDLVRSWARRKNATPAQLSLAWLLAQKALDRADSGDHQHGPHDGEPGGGVDHVQRRRVG